MVEDSYNSDSDRSDRSASPEIDWIDETVKAAKADTRKQPWKNTFGNSVGNRFDDGKDLVTIEKSVGGKFDPACPFRTRGSSLVA
jgi:hypothetical protein